MNKNILKILVLLFTLLQIFSAYGDCLNPSYEVDNVCIDNLCQETGTGIINISNQNTIKIYKNYDYAYIKINDKLTNKINSYKFRYDDTKYKLEGYCKDNNCTQKEDRFLTLADLLNINTKFKVEKNLETKEYINGKNYLLRNYNTVLSNLEYSVFNHWMTFSLKNDISNNITDIGVNSNFLRFRNICEDYTCKTTYSKDIYINDNYNYRYIFNGDSSSFNLNDYIKHKNIDSLIYLDKSIVKAGNPLTINFGFEDILPDSGCDKKSYKYLIYNSSTKNSGSLVLEQQFNLRLSDLNIMGTLDDNNFVKPSKIGNKLTIKISEPFIKTVVGLEKYYIDIIDENENYKTEDQINSIPVEIIAGDPYSTGSIIIPEYDKTKNYYPGDTIPFKIKLVDNYGNPIKDEIKGINIDYAGNGAYKFVQSGMITDKVVGLKNNSNGEFEFVFKPMTNGFYEKKFNVSYYIRDNNGNVTNTIISFILKDETELGIIFIDKLGNNNDFKVYCTKQNITLKTNCISDNFSGCDHSKSQVKTFTSNIGGGGLVIIDNAYNQKSYSYNIQHIDKITPVLSIDGYTFGQTYNIKATDSISLYISDKTAPACNNEDYLGYKVYDIDNSTVYYSGTTNSGILQTKIQLDILKFVGTKNLAIETSDKYNNKINKSIKFIVIPDDTPVEPIIVLPPDSIKYANNSDFYTYKITLKDMFGNPIKGKKINSIKQDCTYINGCKSIKTNMVKNTGNDALSVYGYTGKTTNSSGEITFNIKSVSPGIFSQYFKITLSDWDSSYIDLGTNLELTTSNLTDIKDFKKPYTANLNVSNNNGLTWTGSVKFGSAEKYRLFITNKSALSGLVGQYSIFGFENDIKATDETNFKVTNSNIKEGLEFEATINTSFSGANVNGDLGLKTNPNPIIKYNLGGKYVLYRIGMDYNDYFNIIPISIENPSGFLGVKIIGTLQGQGKQEITGQESNFSDLSKQSIRDSIRKNAYKYISSVQTNSGVINGVKYVEGDITISGDQLYETLIVKNGNVIIVGDLNTFNKKLGIIVLKDGYNVADGYNNKGNIYVKPNVTKINAIIYADGGIISVDNAGNPYSSDTVMRTHALQKQLIMIGSLFTRNTIGGSILSGGDYKLPGGKSTNNFDNAMIYDLNYVRRGKESCLEDSSGVCKYNDGAFVIIYNPKVQTNPPKLFGK